MELAPCTPVCETQTVAGCQGFIGPFPSAFLDKFPITIGIKKNWCKDKGQNKLDANIFSKLAEILSQQEFSTDAKSFRKDALICKKFKNAYQYKMSQLCLCA